MSKQLAFQRILRVLLVREGDGEGDHLVLSRRGRKSGLPRLVSVLLPVREDWPIDCFERCMKVVTEALGDPSADLKPLGWLGKHRKVIEKPMFEGGIPTEYKILTLVVKDQSAIAKSKSVSSVQPCSIPLATSSPSPQVSKSSPKEELEKFGQKISERLSASGRPSDFHRNVAALKWTWTPLSQWVRQVWLGEIVNHPEQQHILPSSFPTLAKFQEFIEVKHGLRFDGFDNEVDSPGMERLYAEMRLGLCQFYEDAAKAEKYMKRMLQTDIPVGCSLIREEQICRTQIGRPGGETILYEISSEDFSSLVFKLPGQRFQILDPGDSKWGQDVSMRHAMLPGEAVTKMMEERLGISLDCVAFKSFSPPVAETGFSRRFPGILTKYIVHYVYVELKVGLLSQWQDLPGKVSEVFNDVRCQVREHSKVTIPDEVSTSRPFVVRTLGTPRLQGDQNGPPDASSTENRSSASPNSSSAQPKSTAEKGHHSILKKVNKRWEKIREAVRGGDDSSVYLWMTEAEFNCYHPPTELDVMQNRFLFLQEVSDAAAQAATFAASRRTKHWISTILLEAAMHGHTAIIQKCMAATRNLKLDAEIINTAVDQAIGAAAKQYRTDTVRLLVHFHLEQVRKFLDNQHIRNLQLSDRAKLQQARLQQLLHYTSFAGDGVSVRALMQIGIELGMPMGGARLCSWSMEVNRTLVELDTDMSYLMENREDTPQMQTLKCFLGQFVRSEMHKSECFLNVINFVANCQLPLHQCAACALVLIRMQSSSVRSHRERETFGRFAEMFMSIIVRALDECGSLEQARQLLRQDDGSPAHTRSTSMSELAVVGKLTRVIEHHSFQELARDDLRGTSRFAESWEIFDKLMPWMVLNIPGLLWRFTLTGLLTLYLVFEPLLILLIWLFLANSQRVVAFHQDVHSMLQSSYFKMLSTNMSYVALMLALIVRAQMKPTQLDSNMDPLEAWASATEKSFTELKITDAFLILWSGAFLCQNASLVRALLGSRGALVSGGDDFLEAMRVVSFLTWVGCWIRAVFIDGGEAESMGTAEQFLGIFAMFSFFRLFSLFKLHPRLGPLWFCMRALLVDVTNFAIVLAISLLGFWIALKFCISGRAFADGGNEGTGFSALGLVVWTIFGEFNLERNYKVFNHGSEPPDLKDFLLEILLFACLLINSVVLVNLLIAMMNNTFDSRMVEADAQRNTEIYFFLQQYKTFTVAPPPLNLIVLVFAGLAATVRLAGTICCRRRPGVGVQRASEAQVDPASRKGSERNTRGGSLTQSRAESPHHSERSSGAQEETFHQKASIHSVFMQGLNGMDRKSTAEYNSSLKGKTEDELEFRSYLLLREQADTRKFISNVCNQLRLNDESYERHRQGKIYRILEHRLGFSEIREQIGNPELPSWALQPVRFDAWESEDAIQEALEKYLPPMSWDMFRKDGPKLIFDEHRKGKSKLELLESPKPNNHDTGSSQEYELRPRLIRTMRTVQLILRHESKPCYLIEIYEFRGKIGDIRVLNRLPYMQLPMVSSSQMKELSNEDIEQYTRACLERKLPEVEGRSVQLVGLVQHTQDPRLVLEESASYPGLHTKYYNFIVECVVSGLPEHDFVTIEREQDKSHHWKWMTETELVEVLSHGSSSAGIMKRNGVTSQQVDEVKNMVESAGQYGNRLERIEALAQKTSSNVERIVEALDKVLPVTHHSTSILA